MTFDELKQAGFVLGHQCGICGVPVGYSVHREFAAAVFNSACGCGQSEENYRLVTNSELAAIPTPSSIEECDHDWFDCSNAVIAAPTKSCRKCGWTVHEDGPEGVFIQWPWMVPGDHHRYYSDEILQQVASLTNVEVASDRTPATAPNVTAEMVDAWRIAFHGSYDGGKGCGDYNDHIRKGLEAAFVRREGEAKSSGAPNPTVKALEWDRWGRSVGAVHHYQIEQGRMAHYGKWFVRTSGVGKSQLYDTEDEAKSAAQADYESRVLSALTLTPTPKAAE